MVEKLILGMSYRLDLYGLKTYWDMKNKDLVWKEISNILGLTDLFKNGGRLMF